ncbi:MAG: hypothetical protein GY747_04630 [Planctomycetes bacterium]|nr:hypothetical protein [Planctomycetota bacterium]MCP4771457.1 hypothetical protein [Planctomycetota bacterium]MCP4861118.1 hypothetical protein [Planctomycetota bacterium]
MNSSPKNKGSFLINGALACGVLFYVLRLSDVDRTAIDWTVIALVCAAILWNVVKLGHILYCAGGGKYVWYLTRTLTFWIVGWFNTAMIQPEDAGGWKNWLGWLLLAMALCDSVSIWHKERNAPNGPKSADSAGTP